MPKRSSKKKDSDSSQVARSIVEQVTGGPLASQGPAQVNSLEIENLRDRKSHPKRRKNRAAVALGRLGGKKGGHARAVKLTPEQRIEIARKAARARWNVGDGVKNAD